MWRGFLILPTGPTFHFLVIDGIWCEWDDLRTWRKCTGLVPSAVYTVHSEGPPTLLRGKKMSSIKWASLYCTRPQPRLLETQSDTVGVGGLVVTSTRDHSMCVVLDWCQCRQVRVGLHISLSVIGTQCQCHCEVVCQGKDWLILQQKCQSSGEDLTEAGAGNNRFASQLCSAIIPLRSPCHCVQVFSHTAHSHTLNK